MNRSEIQETSADELLAMVLLVRARIQRAQPVARRDELMARV